MFSMRLEQVHKFECPRCGKWITMESIAHYIEGTRRWCLYPPKQRGKRWNARKVRR